jgi:hypothetical protein
MSRTSLLVLLWLCVACGAGPEARLEKARKELASGDYAAAAQSAEQGLAAGAQGATAWRLELAGLEAEARGAKSSAVLARLTRLAGGTFAAQLVPSLYVQTAGQLKQAGDAAGAVGVLDAGAKRFPQDPEIAKAIDQSKASGSPEELERLRSLGYVE